MRALWLTYNDVLIKMLLCTLLTGLIGYNREKNGTPIGIRTHIVVGLSAVIIQITALRYSNMNTQTDHMRLAGQFISGIAFLGTGTIIKDKGNIRGLTTASSIFFAACIGISVGTGMYIEATLVTLLAYVFLTDIMGIKQYLRTSNNRIITMKVEFKGNCCSCQQVIGGYFKEINVSVLSVEMIMASTKSSKVLLKVLVNEQTTENDLLMKAVEIPSILKAEIVQG